MVDVTLLVLALLALAAWIGLWLDPARRWPREKVLPPASGGLPDAEAEVHAIVPARNEAASLPETLPRLLEQGPPVRCVVLVDDRSCDDTARAAQRIADDTDGPTPLEIVTVSSLPEGWAGKVHAMQTGVDHADRSWRAEPHDRWILFTDADIEHPRDVTHRLLAKAAAGPFDLVSVMARLRAESFWERVLIPAFVWFFHAMYPFRRVSVPGGKVAAAAGGLMLVRREALANADGPAAWKNAIIDDLALARGLKNAGGRLWLGFAEDVVSRRAYPTLASIVEMVARSAFVELRYRYALVPLVWVALLLAFVVPPTALAVGVATSSLPLALVGGLAWALETLHVLPSFRWHKTGVRFALLMPAAAALYAWMTTLSAWRHLRGRVTGWREA